jgi:hypothetical protein
MTGRSGSAGEHKPRQLGQMRQVADEHHVAAAVIGAAQIAGSSRGARPSASSIGTPSASPQAAAV